MIKQTVLAAVVALAFGAPALQAAEAHGHGTEGVAALELNQGQKWQTDAPLRSGMSNLRAALAGSLEAIHDNRATDKQYEALAAKVNGEVAGIVQNCKLEPAADAQLHVLIAEMLGGADAMQGKDAQADRRAGAVRVAKALNAYGEHFDHPGWRGL